MEMMCTYLKHFRFLKILNWFLIFRGSAIAKIVGFNVLSQPDRFEPRVNMYMYEEKFEGRKLTEVVNERHENVKYLPGVKLPNNVVSSVIS